MPEPTGTYLAAAYRALADHAAPNPRGTFKKPHQALARPAMPRNVVPWHTTPKLAEPLLALPSLFLAGLATPCHA